MGGLRIRKSSLKMRKKVSKCPKKLLGFSIFMHINKRNSFEITMSISLERIHTNNPVECWGKETFLKMQSFHFLSNQLPDNCINCLVP